VQRPPLQLQPGAGAGSGAAMGSGAGAGSRISRLFISPMNSFIVIPIDLSFGKGDRSGDRGSENCKDGDDREESHDDFGLRKRSEETVKKKFCMRKSRVCI